MSVKIYHFLYKLSQSKSAGAKLADFYFSHPPRGTNGLSMYLVKVPEALDKVVDGVGDLLAGHGLHHREEHLKGHPGVGLALEKEGGSGFVKKSSSCTFSLISAKGRSFLKNHIIELHLLFSSKE